MPIACWLPKATNTHSEYVKRIDFPLQQPLHERASMLRYACTACLACSVCSVGSSLCDELITRSDESYRVFVCVCVCVCACAKLCVIHKPQKRRLRPELESCATKIFIIYSDSGSHKTTVKCFILHDNLWLQIHSELSARRQLHKKKINTFLNGVAHVLATMWSSPVTT